MDIFEIKKQIQKGDIAPIYVVYGTQKLLMEELVDEIKKKLLDETNAEFNMDIYNLEEQPLEYAIEAAETFPFMSEHRLVIAKEANFLSAAKSTSKVEHNIDSLERYLEEPVDFSVLILLIHQEKLDERKKIVKQLKKKAVLCQASSLPHAQMLRFVQERVDHQQVTIEEEAANLLLQFVGENLLLLANEINKMSSYVGKNGQITSDVVHQLIAKTIEQDVFSLVDHVMNLRIAEADQALQELLKRKEEPIKILALLARQIRIILRVKELDRLGYTGNQMAQQLKVHPYACKVAAQQGKRFSSHDLLQMLHQLAEMDYQMKSGQMDKELALQLFLLQLNTA